MNLDLKLDFEGLFKIRKYKKINDKEVITYNSPWIKNLVVTSGLNSLLNESSYLTHCRIGSSNISPQITDTDVITLINTKAASALSQDNTNGHVYNSANDFYTWVRRKYLFGVGEAEGEVRELAIGNVISSTFTCFSRTLVKDLATGNPITVTVAADEYLDITYELRCYPSTLIQNITLPINNIGGTAVAQLRPLSASISILNNQTINYSAPFSITNSFPPTIYSTNDNLYNQVGVIGTMPVNSTTNAGIVTTIPYTSGTFSRQIQSFWDRERIAGTTFRTICILTRLGNYAVAFQSQQSKSSAQTMLLQFNIMVARKV